MTSIICSSRRISILVICYIVITSSCASELSTQTTSVDTLEFIIEDGYKIELVASEPLLNSPVASYQDLEGRLWVVEMPGYMRDINASDEALRDGKIVVLEDNDQDGIMDTRKVVMDHLQNPRSICLIYGGILYTDSTSLIWAKLDDLQAINKEVVDDQYIIGGNIEHQPNGLFYNLDNWIYNAKSNARYKKTKGEWIKEPTSFRGQWGITSDKSGRLIYNHNSAPIIGDALMPNVLINNKYQKIENGIGLYYTEDYSIYPIQSTAVNRGYEEGVLDSLGRVINYTSACSPLVYHGDNMYESDISDIFVCAPEANLVVRYKANHEEQSAKRITHNEFLASKDETFRPVHLMNGVDGSLYVTDLRKGIIQHTAYMSSYLRELILARKLDKVNGKGRIYKISRIENHKNHEAPQNKVPHAKTDWQKLLVHNNYRHRLEGQKKIIHLYNNREITKTEIETGIAKLKGTPLVHALYVKDELGLLTTESLLDVYPYNISHEHIISLAPLWKKYDKPWVNDVKIQYLDIYRSIINRQNLRSNIQIAPNLAAIPKYWKELIMMVRLYPDSALLVEAIISGLENEEIFLEFINKEPKLTLLREKLSSVIANKKDHNNQAPQLITQPIEDSRTNGLITYQRQCVSCHGIDGKGQKNIAPSLTESAILKGPESEIARTILHGFDSGTEVYQIKMPGYKNDPQMDNQKVAELVEYLLSTFAQRWGGISPTDIEKIRSEI